MKPDDALQDQQSLRDEFDCPQSVHGDVFARLAAEHGIEVYRRGASRLQYAEALAGFLRDHPDTLALFKQRQSIRLAMAIASMLAASKA